MGDEGKLQKMEVDYSATVEEKIPECEKMAKNGKLNEAIEILLSLEKQTRTGADMHSTAKILISIVKMCFEQKKWELLNENILTLTKRRGQLKQAVTKMVQEAMTYLDKTPSMAVKLKLIDTLRTVTAGKIYVEIERARLTRILAEIKENQGDINEAATILQELQVETYGSMEKREKVEFILEQMRLCLAKKDYIRTQIISKKVSSKFFDDSTEDLKIKFYELMIELDEHHQSYLAICKHYRQLLQTKAIQEEVNRRNDILKCVVLYLILAPFDNEQSDLIHRVKGEKDLSNVPKYKQLIEFFTTDELMRWTEVKRDFESELTSGASGSGAAAIFNTKTDQGTSRWKDFKVRIVEHNIRVMAKYYVRITLKRMAELLELTEAEAEEFLSNLVVNKTVSAKIDRLDGIVQFSSPKDPNSILNDWNHSVVQLMNHINKATHLITKEQMVHKVK